MSGVPYIGAKISLISRAEIRYDGILAMVDPKEASIALENVRLMGTEGRRPGSEIPASASVYDYVIFRSTDIKDLQVYDAPEPMPLQPPSLAAVDPAVVSMSQPHPAPSLAEPISFGQHNAHYQEPQSSHHWRDEFPGKGQSSPYGAVRPTFGAVAAEAASQSYHSRTDIPKYTTRQQAPEPTQLPPPQRVYGGSAARRPSAAESAGEQRKSVYSYSTERGRIEHLARAPQRSRPQQDYSGPRKNPPAPIPIPTADYNFAEANARFSKEHAAEELVAPELDSTGDPSAFYDKTSSFFDNISCEAKEVMNGTRRDRLRDERVWNVETFGQARLPDSSSYGNRGHRQGRGRGGYGYGYGRGGQRGGYHAWQGRGGYGHRDDGDNKNN